MPTYDYECRAGHRFELFHSMSDETPKKCPICGKRARRVPSAGAGLLFKGSGFYITDYRSPAYQEKAKSERAESGGTPAESSGGGSGSSDKAGGAAPAAEPKKRGKKESGGKS